MNGASRDALWRRLAATGLVRGDAPPPTPAADGGAWYIRAMIGVAAWIAAVFLLAFIGMALSDLVRTAGAKVAAGIALCVGAAFVLRASVGVFAGQLGLALSLTGQALFAAGVTSVFRYGGVEGAIGALVIAAFEALLAAVIPNVVHRVVATLAAALALAWGLWVAGLGTLGLVVAAAAFVVVELSDGALARWPRATPAFGLGLALAIVAILPVQVSADGFGLPGFRKIDPLVGFRLADIAMGIVFFGAALWLIARSGMTRGGAAYFGVLAGAAALALLSVWVPGLAATLLILVVGFGTGQRLLTGIGTIAMLAALSRYYYALSATLLAKSATLVVVGAVLLLLWLALRRGGARAEGGV